MKKKKNLRALKTSPKRVKKVQIIFVILYGITFMFLFRTLFELKKKNVHYPYAHNTRQPYVLLLVHTCDAIYMESANIIYCANTNFYYTPEAYRMYIGKHLIWRRPKSVAKVAATCAKSSSI